MIKIEVHQGDITRQALDAIVNAANETLLGGGGVDGAIHQAAGPELIDECRTLGGCPTGEARITAAYNLPAHHVIHTVGPVWQGGAAGEPGLLVACYESCLKLSEENEIASIAFPAISTGAFGYPLHRAARIALNTVRSYPVTYLSLVRFVCFDAQAVSLYRALLRFPLVFDRPLL